MKIIKILLNYNLYFLNSFSNIIEITHVKKLNVYNL